MPLKMMQKKSQGLSINTMIIAVIALVVLIVVIAIFTNFSGKTAKNIGSCEAKGGKCADELPNGKCGKGSDGKNYPVPIIVSGDCENRGNEKINGLCCIAISNE